MSKSKPNILLIYTGGTIGMIKDHKTGVLKAFDFKHLLKRIPELQLLDCKIDTVSFQTPIDSSNMNPDYWLQIAEIIESNYKSFDGFVNWVLDLRKKLDMPHKLSEVIDEKDFDLDRLSKMALADPSTGGNPKKLTENDMKIMYQHSMTGELF